ncbi:hypothetical protein AB205_0043580 [Aquarana catesbeiana]|uniref:BED-type domain-containing protein n=1 Tax=Aquarana catesbeiana TaxID=8400 RepID=A0A2G9RBC7_AQUCT|nr:hypothetical protein AB205_0043580 [Aquarana catesbeiana]
MILFYVTSKRWTMSAVWKYFKVSDKDPKFAICALCSTEISRGGTVPKNFSTTGLIHHLKTWHPVQHSDYKKTVPLSKSASGLTLSVATVFEKVKKYASNSPKAHAITAKIMEFTALDNQPFSVVEHIGFRRLKQHIEPRSSLPSRCYFADTSLHELFSSVRKHVQELMTTDIIAISFTTDI